MVSYARADLVSNIVEPAWLTRYPLPSKNIVEHGNELLAEFKTISQADYSITVKPITSRNPQANFILESAHQTIGNIISSFKVQDIMLDDEKPWEVISSSFMFALRATVHTTPQHTPAQLVYGRD